jgi:hypothetical protein
MALSMKQVQQLEAKCEHLRKENRQLALELKQAWEKEERDSAALRQTVADNLAAQDSLFKRRVLGCSDMNALGKPAHTKRDMR